MRGPASPGERVTLVSSSSSPTPARPRGGGVPGEDEEGADDLSEEPVRGRGPPSAAGL